MEKDYKITIGIEVHAELNTKTKAYCKCANNIKEEPNTNICPTCMGLPGALPYFNEEVLKKAIKLGLATKSTIARNGVLEIEMEEGKTREIRIERIHMEEDTAKLNYDNFGRGTLIDFNRGGIPLVEIVSKPDIHSIKEALIYLETLRKLLIYLEIAECKMEEGGFRADVNISVSNTDTLRTKSRNKKHELV